MTSNEIKKFREELETKHGIGIESIKMAPRVKDIIDILSKYPEDWNMFICGQDYDLSIAIDYDQAHISIDDTKTVEEMIYNYKDMIKKEDNNEED